MSSKNNLTVFNGFIRANNAETYAIVNGSKKIVYKFPDGIEMGREQIISSEAYKAFMDGYQHREPMHQIYPDGSASEKPDLKILGIHISLGKMFIHKPSVYDIQYTKGWSFSSAADEHVGGQTYKQA